MSGRVAAPESLRSTFPRQGRPLLSYSLVNLHNVRQEGEARNRHGITNGVWDKAKEETRQLLIEEARAQSVIAYSILAAKVQTVPFSERSQLFFEILTEISREEDAAGRGLLSIVVVHKTEDFRPGPGFFNLARSF